ncbi:hypothetical protein ACX3P1_27415 [Mesorhizobium sp. A623]
MTRTQPQSITDGNTSAMTLSRKSIAAVAALSAKKSGTDGSTQNMAKGAPVNARHVSSADRVETRR